MALKNNLKMGQASLEYFIIFGMIVLLTLASLSSFLPQVKETLQGENGFFQKAAERIIR